MLDRYGVRLRLDLSTKCMVNAIERRELNIAKSKFPEQVPVFCGKVSQWITIVGIFRLWLSRHCCFLNWSRFDWCGTIEFDLSRDCGRIIILRGQLLESCLVN